MLSFCFRSSSKLEPPGCRIANTENEDFLSNFTESSEKMELNFQIERRERKREMKFCSPITARKLCPRFPSTERSLPLPLSLPSDLDRGLLRWKNWSRAELPLGGCRVDWDLARKVSVSNSLSLSTKEKSCRTLRSVRDTDLTLTSCNLGRKRALR